MTISLHMSTLHSRAVQRAAEIAGGVAALAVYLKLSPVTVKAWINGVVEVPQEYFLKVVDIIVDEQVTAARSPGIETKAGVPSRSEDTTP